MIMPRLEGYCFGRLVVNGEVLTRDVIVLPERVVTNWWLTDGHRLVLDDLQDVREGLPEHFVIGTGSYGRLHPDPAVNHRRRTAALHPIPATTTSRPCGTTSCTGAPVFDFGQVAQLVEVGGVGDDPPPGLPQ
jgi:hypothetical protein